MLTLELEGSTCILHLLTPLYRFGLKEGCLHLAA